MFTNYKAVSQRMGKGFEKLSEVFETMFDDCDDETPSSGTSVQSNGQTTITNNNGHVVIEGLVKSLKVNGVDQKV